MRHEHMRTASTLGHPVWTGWWINGSFDTQAKSIFSIGVCTAKGGAWCSASRARRTAMQIAQGLLGSIVWTAASLIDMVRA
jgi:hypothetical protein